MNRFFSRVALVVGLGMLWSSAAAQAAAPAGRFTVMSGGMVFDNKTRLTWQQATSTTTYIYADALTYCSGNTPLLPGTGWRLPAIKELLSLLDDKVVPGIDATAFPSTQLVSYWSSTPYQGGTSSAWIVSFVYGGSTNAPVTEMDYVRCVR